MLPEQEHGGHEEVHGEEEGEMEQALCKLWDLSIDARTCALLLELDALPLLEHIVASLQSKPRTLEVAFGLLSNMASNLSAAANMACSRPMLHSLSRTIMTCTGPGALTQALRFLTAAVMIKEAGDVGVRVEAELNEGRNLLDNVLDDEALLNQARQPSFCSECLAFLFSESSSEL